MYIHMKYRPNSIVIIYYKNVIENNKYKYLFTREMCTTSTLSCINYLTWLADGALLQDLTNTSLEPRYTQVKQDEGRSLVGMPNFIFCTVNEVFKTIVFKNLILVIKWKLYKCDLYFFKLLLKAFYKRKV